jgi:TRAP-type C4-dicarboxylate transport system permease large subunit
VILLAGTATVTAWAIANEQIIYLIITPLSNLPVWAFLLLVNILLLINGMFMMIMLRLSFWVPLLRR